MRILIIEDDPTLAKLLQRGLCAHGYQTVVADNGADGAALAVDETVELVLLDITLPGFDSRQTLQHIRARRPQLPLLVLSARDDLENKVDTLHAGADDYLTKPVAFEELLARIRAVTRRFDQPESSKLRAGKLRLDLLAQRVWRGDALVDLSRREFALLGYFMRHPHQVLSRQQILLAVWDYDFDPETNVVDVYVRYLRSKIDEPGEPSLIATVRGVGYRFESPPAEGRLE